MLRVDHLRVGGLAPVSFEVADGECLAVMGPSGAGKSRLLRAIADLEPAEGQIFLNGIERAEMSGPEWRRHVRYMAAEPGWWDETARLHMAAMAEAGAGGATPSLGAGSRIERMVRELGLETAILDRPIAELSSGERQRLALIRAVSDDPDALLLDEPTAALDTQARALAEELIKFLVLSNKSVLVVTHDAAQARRLGRRCLLVANGRVEEKAL